MYIHIALARPLPDSEQRIIDGGVCVCVCVHGMVSKFNFQWRMAKRLIRFAINRNTFDNNSTCAGLKRLQRTPI